MKTKLISVYLLVLLICKISTAVEPPVIFPFPQQMEITGSKFDFDQNTRILVPQNAGQNDLKLAYELVADISDKFGEAITVEHLSQLPAGGNYIVMGNIDNQLIRDYCLKNKIEFTPQNPGKEGYVLRVNSETVVVAGWDDRGAFYGLQSLRQLLKMEEGNIISPGIHVRDWPNLPFRGIKVYVPGKESIPFFERFLKDFMALYKFNKVILEMNAVMRLDSHPELNAGSVEFGKELIYSRRERPVGPNREFQNSTHHDAGDGGILEKREVADIVEFANDQYIEVIPEITSLTHSYYLLTRHRELAEIKDAEWPDTYCPSNPKSYELLIDVMDEYIEVMNPGMIMIGHDEWRMAVDACPLCKGKNYTELFAQDVNKIYDYLSRKNIKVSMWGDHLLESVRDKGIRKGSDYNRSYDRPGALSPEQVKTLIPKDIVIFNWFWSGENGENNDIQVEKMGFKQVYGNFRPEIENWKRRGAQNSVMGGAPSSWAASTEFNFGKDLINDFLGCANLLWSSYWPEKKELVDITQSLMPQVRQNLSGKILPGDDNNAINPVDITSRYNVTQNKTILDQNLPEMITGKLTAGKKIFDMADASAAGNRVAIAVGSEGEKKTPLPGEVKGIKIDKDVSSLIFLHACALPEKNEMSYYYIYNFDDAAALLGWYEIIYEDGLTETIPVRYGVNILEWDKSSDNYCYYGEAVDCSAAGNNDPVVFFAYEWVNPRFGKKIKEINLKGSKGFTTGRDGRVRVHDNNAIILKALSVVEKREVNSKIQGANLNYKEDM